MSKAALAGAVLLVCAFPASGAVVYNAQAPNPAGVHLIHEPDEMDSGTEVPQSGRENDGRIGDLVTLAGTERFVTEFATRLWSFQQPVSPVTADVELTLYESAGGLPGALIWTGTAAGVTLAGATPVTVTFNPNITVPDSLCFALAFLNISGTRPFGVVTSPTVLVGTSPLSTLRQDSQSGLWRQDPGLNPGPDVFDHVDARITAVPSPLCASLLALPLLARRRSR